MKSLFGRNISISIEAVKASVLSKSTPSTGLLLVFYSFTSRIFGLQIERIIFPGL